MSLFRKIFGNTGNKNKSDGDAEKSPYAPDVVLPIDEMFTHNFKKNGGKFIYCEDLAEVSENFINILEENDWFESVVACHESQLFHFLEENKLVYKNNPSNPKFYFSTCENLIASEGSILFSSNQLKQYRPNDLPTDMIVFATTSQFVNSKSDGLRHIKKKYDKEYPTNITTIKYFEKAKEEDFLQYGTAHKNLYLLLLEDL